MKTATRCRKPTARGYFHTSLGRTEQLLIDSADPRGVRRFGGCHSTRSRSAKRTSYSVTPKVCRSPHVNAAEPVALLTRGLGDVVERIREATVPLMRRPLRGGRMVYVPGTGYVVIASALAWRYNRAGIDSNTNETPWPNYDPAVQLWPYGPARPNDLTKARHTR